MLKGFKMAKPILFSLMLITLCTVFEVRGAKRPSPADSTPQSPFSAVNKQQEDISGDQFDNSPFASMLPLGNFGSFRSKPIVSRTLSGNELSDFLGKSLFKDMGPAFQQKWPQYSFTSANKNGYNPNNNYRDQSNGGINGARMVGANYGPSPNQSQYSIKYSTSPADKNGYNYSNKYGQQSTSGNNDALQAVDANGPRKPWQIQQFLPQKISPTVDQDEDDYPQNGGVQFTGNGAGGALAGANEARNTLTGQQRNSPKNSLPSAVKSAAGHLQNDGDDDSDGDDNKASVGAAAGQNRFSGSQYPSDLHKTLRSSLSSIFQQGNMNPSAKGVKIEHFNNNGLQGIRMHISRCCTADNNCYVLEEGEKCGLGNAAKNGINDKQKSKMPNDKIFQQLGPSGFGPNDDDISSPESNGQYNDFGNQLFGGGTKYLSSNGNLDSYRPTPGPLNHPYVAPKGLTKEEADKIRKYVYEKHNFYRQKHRMTKLTLNEQLSNYAQDWANKLVNKEMQHRQENIYGENIARGHQIRNIGYEAVDQFYDEIALYNPNDDENGLYNNNEIHHLTQILWNWTTTLGVGVSKSSDGQYTIVCNYDPSGNMEGFFKKNLPEITQKEVDEGTITAEENKNKRQPQFNVSYRVIRSPVFS